MEAAEYITGTRPAVLHVLAALDEYDSLTAPPSLAEYSDTTGVVTLDQKTGGEYLSRLRDSMALDIAKATLCGALCQIAHTALNLFSVESGGSPESTQFGIKESSRALKLCVGRKIHGIPAGLLIYAARVQHNHWDEAELQNQVVISILNALREHYRTDVSYDVAYAWHWPGPRPIAHQIVRHELEWFQYQDYLADLRTALPGLDLGES